MGVGIGVAGIAYRTFLPRLRPARAEFEPAVDRLSNVTMIVIEVQNLTKDYETGFWKKKKVRALEDLTLTVEGGQIFGFLGGNGAGKTTTIKILMTLLYPTSG